MTTKQVCSVEVSEPGTWGAFHHHPCTRPAKVELDGKLYCTIHDPQYIKASSGAKCFHRSYGGCGTGCGKPAVANEYGFGICARHTQKSLRAKERLIAAAPDLLAALLALVNAHDAQIPLDQGDARWPVAQAAITKAKGESYDP